MSMVRKKLPYYKANCKICGREYNHPKGKGDFCSQKCLDVWKEKTKHCKTWILRMKDGSVL